MRQVELFVYFTSFSFKLLLLLQANTRKRMSKSDFVRNNRGIDDGHDLSHKFLEDVWIIAAIDSLLNFTLKFFRSMRELQ